MSEPAERKPAGAAQGKAAAHGADAATLHRAALAAHRAGRLEEAMAGYRRVIALQPRSAATYNSMGAALFQAGKHLGAAAWYREALALGDEDARSNLGETYRKLGRLDDAESLLREALARRPYLENTRFLLARTLQEAGRLEESLTLYDEILKANPKNGGAAWNRALVLLHLGRYREGFEAYEGRYELLGLKPQIEGAPRWRGEPLDGRAILVRDEQGFGDALQFARFVPAVAARGGRVILQCRGGLVRLLASLDGVSEVIAREDTPPRYDLWVPLMSLPHLFGISLDTLPSPGRYLSPPDDLIARFRRITARPADTVKVGLVWAGGTDHREDRKRSAALANFAELLGLPGIAWFSLQVGPRAADIAELGIDGLIADLAPEFVDFAATAAAVENLDLVISIDSAVAHLAGALAKPIWLALPAPGEWRYLPKRPDNPWYPSMRVFHQPRFGDWDSVVREMATALESREGTEASGKA